jgi:hypothetical protein
MQIQTDSCCGLISNGRLSALITLRMLESNERGFFKQTMIASAAGTLCLMQPHTQVLALSP